jgi:cephalosporin-C deacetylase-like acetyl esterase
LSDLSLEELVRYLPMVEEPHDFDHFWRRTLTEARSHDLEVGCHQVSTPYRTVTVWDVSFSGYAGNRISAWLTTPRGPDGPLPAVVEFVGYGVAGLVPDLTAVMPDVPFLCHFRRALEVCENDPYDEITRYLSVRRQAVDQVFATLSYFDAVNFSKRGNAPAFFSVGLRDLTCPPSTVYAAFNHYAAEKEMKIYEFNDHEGGLSHQKLAQIAWLGRNLGRTDS